MGADQLAVVAGEAMAACGADLAVVVDGERVNIIGSAMGWAGRRGAGLGADGRTTL
jgi:hypothetical protein